MLAKRIRSKLARLISFFSVNYYRLMGVKIGKRSYISLGAHMDVRRGKISIGNHVSISNGCYILSHTGYRPLKEGHETVIEDNVKIFVSSVIIPEVRIGKNSIVGAGAVVMKDVPPNVIVMGNPARVIEHLDEKNERTRK